MRPTERIERRIKKVVKDFVKKKRSQEREDITSEQREYERSISELHFRPNTSKS